MKYTVLPGDLQRHSITTKGRLLAHTLVDLVATAV